MLSLHSWLLKENFSIFQVEGNVMGIVPAHHYPKKSLYEFFLQIFVMIWLKEKYTERKCSICCACVVSEKYYLEFLHE